MPAKQRLAVPYTTDKKYEIPTRGMCGYFFISYLQQLAAVVKEQVRKRAEAQKSATK
jgi:hypothetical protein